MRLVGVYEDADAARAAAQVARRAGADPDDIRIGERLDRVVSLEGEMREEMDRTVAGPGNVGPFTKEMWRGMHIAIPIGAVVGLLLALPIAAIPFDFPVWARLLVCGVVGLSVGATVGWVVGGGFGAKRGEEPLAAEHGITLSVTATDHLRELLARTRPVRLDLVTERGEPVQTVTTEHSEPVTRTMGRNVASEERRS
jgi:hypothetical protein